MSYIWVGWRLYQCGAFKFKYVVCTKHLLHKQSCITSTVYPVQEKLTAFFNLYECVVLFQRMCIFRHFNDACFVVWPHDIEACHFPCHFIVCLCIWYSCYSWYLIFMTWHCVFVHLFDIHDLTNLIIETFRCPVLWCCSQKERVAFLNKTIILLARMCLFCFLYFCSFHLFLKLSYILYRNTSRH